MNKKQLLAKVWIHRRRRLPPNIKDMVAAWNINTNQPCIFPADVLRKAMKQINYSEEHCFFKEKGLKQIREELTEGGGFLKATSPYCCDQWYIIIEPEKS